MLNVVGLLWPFAAVPHQSYFVLAEICIRDGLFISNDSQLLKERRQLAGIENHGWADWSALGYIAMESFHDENPTRLERALFRRKIRDAFFHVVRSLRMHRRGIKDTRNNRAAN
jgi:hypothetical protein